MNIVCLSGKVQEIRHSGKCTYITVLVRGIKENDFLDVTLFKATAEFFNNYFDRGQWINIIGHIRKSNYNNVFRTEIIADKISFCGNKAQAEQDITDDGFTDITDDEPLPWEI